MQVLGAGTYEAGRVDAVGNIYGVAAGWSEGDWNADGVFDTADLITAFRDGGYELEAANEVAVVPEPREHAVVHAGREFGLGYRRTAVLAEARLTQRIQQIVAPCAGGVVRRNRDIDKVAIQLRTGPDVVHPLHCWSTTGPGEAAASSCVGSGLQSEDEVGRVKITVLFQSQPPLPGRVPGMLSSAQLTGGQDEHEVRRVEDSGPPFSRQSRGRIRDPVTLNVSTAEFVPSLTVSVMSTGPPEGSQRA